MQSVVSIIAIVFLLLASTAGVADWLFFRPAPSFVQVSTLKDSGPGSLRQAIADAKSGGAITFAAGLKGTIMLTSADLNISKNLTIRGPNVGLLTISGIHDNGVVVFPHRTVTISDIAFKDSNNIIYNQGTLIISNSTISGNTATGNVTGSPIYNASSGVLIINTSTISGNTAAMTGGGAIYNASSGTLTISTSTISGNTARNNSGGAIYNAGRLTLTNSTIASNTASDYGGAIENYGGRLNITFCTIYDNTAGTGGGIANEDITDSNGGIVPSPVRIRNSIIAGNHATNNPDLLGTFISNGYNLIEVLSSGTIIHDAVDSKTDIIGKSPNVGSLQKNAGPTLTYALFPGSPAIDKIPLIDCRIKDIYNSQDHTFTDQRGMRRPAGNEGACDIGAYESSP